MDFHRFSVFFIVQWARNGPGKYTEKLELEKNKEGQLLIPFSAVIAMGDFLVVSEEDIA